MNGKLSVIIPVYNTGLYLKKALNSIVQQTYRELEIIIIDDGSTDESSDVYSEFAQMDNRIIIHKTENGGVASARNTGLSLSTGDYITFFDSDDWLDTQAYQVMLQLLTTTASDIAVCGYVNEFEDSRFMRANYNIKGTEIKSAQEMLRDMLLDKNSGFCCNKIFRRKVIFEHNLRFDSRLSVLEDFHFLVEVCGTRPQFICTEKAFYHYYRRDDSASKAFVNDRKFTMNLGSELILNKIKIYFPELLGPAAEFFYNTNIGLLNEVYHSKPVSRVYINSIRGSIKKAGLLDRINKKVRLKAALILYFPKLFALVKNLYE